MSEDAENLDGQKSKRGGKRPGAGRKKGSKNKCTADAKVALSALAQQHTETALNALIDIASNGESEAARVSAAVAILDRGYGRPPQSLNLGGPNGERLGVTVEFVSGRQASDT